MRIDIVEDIFVRGMGRRIGIVRAMRDGIEKLREKKRRMKKAWGMEVRLRWSVAMLNPSPSLT